MHVEIKNMPELYVATVEHVGSYSRISDAFARLHAIASAAGLVERASGMLAIYLDDPATKPAAELRSEAALVVPSELALPAGLGERRVPAGRYAMTTHLGAYEMLGDVWRRLIEWVPASGERMSGGVRYEIYKNTPETTPQAKLETELYVPLA